MIIKDENMNQQNLNLNTCLYFNQFKPTMSNTRGRLQKPVVSQITETESSDFSMDTIPFRGKGARQQPQPWYEIKSKEFIEGLVKHRMESFIEERKKRNGQQEAMTNVTKQRIIDAKFDFSALSGCVSDIRQRFWNYDRVNDFYKKKLQSQHSHFYQKIVPGRTEEREEMTQKLKQGGFISALRLVDDDPEEKKIKALAKNNEVKFDSGSEKDSYRPENDSVHWSDSDKNDNLSPSKVNIDMTYDPTIIKKQAKQIDNEMKKKMAIAKTVAAKMQQLQHQKATNQQNQDEEVPDVSNQSPNTRQLKQQMFQKQQTLAVQNVQSMIADISSGLKKLTSQDNVMQDLGLSKEDQLLLLGGLGDVNSFEKKKSHPKGAAFDGKRRSSRRTTAGPANRGKQVQFYQKMTNEEFQAELMSDSDLSRITFSLFDKMIKDQDVCQELAIQLSQHLHTQYHRDYSFEEIMAQIAYVDKSLFISLRDGQLTLAQLKARVAERRGFAKYKVLDDIYTDMTEEEKTQIKNQPNLAKFLFGPNPRPEDYIKPLEPWQSDPRCIRSIKYHHKKGRVVPKFLSSTRNPSQSKLDGANLTSLEGNTTGGDMNKTQSRDQLLLRQSQMQHHSTHHSAQPVNSLIDERSVKTKKARMNKELELRRHVVTINNLKRKLAKQIVSKTAKIEEFKQLTINDLFQHQVDMEGERRERIQRNINMYKTPDEKERNRLLNQRWQNKVNGFIQSQVQHYSTSFELEKGLTAEQEELIRLRYKINDPYAFFQEKQNQIQNAYQLMAQYKTVQQIEQEIKQAQDYLYLADQYYSNRPTHGRRSPTKAEYDYIKRLVDDGQPVVLTKKIRKALKIKDDMETIDKAIKEDLKAAGYTKEEIEGHQQKEVIDFGDQSEEDSAERRKRKALKEAKKGQVGAAAAAKQQKRISKKEKARLAYQAERTRQKILNPKLKRPQTGTEVYYESQKRDIRRGRQQTAPHRRARQVKSIVQANVAQIQMPTNTDLQNLDNTSEEPQIQSAMMTRDRNSPVIDYKRNMKSDQNKLIQTSSQAAIQASSYTRLPKYYSSKLIKRNQSQIERVMLDKLLDMEQQPLQQQQQTKQQMTSSSNIIVKELAASSAIAEETTSGLRCNTLKEGITVPSPGGTKDERKNQRQDMLEPMVLSEMTAGSPNANSFKMMTTKQGMNRCETYGSPKGQRKSAFQLKSIKKHFQTSRSVTHHNFKQRQMMGMMMDFNEDSGAEEDYESGRGLDERQLDYYEYQNSNEQMSAEEFRAVPGGMLNRTHLGQSFIRQQAVLENSMSQSMLDFVQFYGLAVQPAANRLQTRQNSLIRTQQAPLMKSSMGGPIFNRNSNLIKNEENVLDATTQSTAALLSSSAGLYKQVKNKNNRHAEVFKSNPTIAGLRSNSTSNVGAVALSGTAGATHAGGKMIDMMESQSDMNFESFGQRSTSNINNNFLPSKSTTGSMAAAARIAQSFKGPGIRAMTANSMGRKPLAVKRERQDLDFNSNPEAAEERMKQQKLLLFKQKLDTNFKRTCQSGNFSKQSDEIQNQKQAKMVATQIAAQAEKNQSSDYNTKAIATRLRSIAQRRIQAANRNRTNNQLLQQQFSSNAQPTTNGNIYQPQNFNASTKQIRITSSRNGRPVIMKHLAKTMDPNQQNMNQIGSSQVDEVTEPQIATQNPLKSKASVTGAAWVYPNVQTLKATTSENSNNNQLMFAKMHQDSVVGLEFNVAADEEPKPPKQSQFSKERMRARSGVPTPTKEAVMPVESQVSDKMRPQCESPFEEIPITSSKKNRLDSRPTTGHHYISKDQAHKNLVNRPSAQTLLAFKNQESIH